jgi:hypothetical protein
MHHLVQTRQRQHLALGRWEALVEDKLLAEVEDTPPQVEDRLPALTLVNRLHYNQPPLDRQACNLQATASPVLLEKR